MTVARPGGAAALIDRNKRGQDTLDVKPSIHQAFEKSVYKPNKYLDARKEHLEASGSTPDVTHMHANRLFNIRKSNMEQKTQIPLGGTTANHDEAKFAESASGARRRSDNDNTFRLNVSQRRQINRAISCASKSDFDCKRNTLNNTIAGDKGQSLLANQGEMILEKKF